MARHDADVVIIGGGISAALLAWQLSERRPGTSIIVVEAGDRMFDAKKRWEQRRRLQEYGEGPWPGDVVADQSAQGIISRSMVVGGSAMHWGGVTNRFSEEDTRLRSMFGLAVDWPITWTELERYYCEAERRIGVSGDPSPLPEDARSEPYPMPGMPLSWNLLQLKAWGEKSGIPFWGTPQAKNSRPYDGRGECTRCNTCSVCPTEARYAPDATFKRLLAAKAITLHDRTIVRRLGAHVVSTDEDRRVQHAVVDLLRDRGLSITTAESVTGGLVARMLVEVPGASAVFRGGFVTYSDAWKRDRLGVGAGLLAAHGAVSEPARRRLPPVAAGARFPGRRAAARRRGRARPGPSTPRARVNGVPRAPGSGTRSQGEVLPGVGSNHG